ncbi:MAG TPA: SMP-30/gluconolactonase/LRE family protein, partial [Gemmataceae bacterium]|nr:SMP-30/gluconolactonase/LRE family protein [Gemmataceae bacterium]
TRYTFAQSKIFPGTTRDYWVYVPKQYDPARPACVYVNQDGIQYNAPAVFDRLIHARDMPVVVGVFVQPGRVKAPSDQALDRFNRSYEYDGLGDAYARFLLEELLPDVEKRTAADGRPIRLSKDGNDRCIAGASSGAICAFTAAWERPDAFRRVFSSIGTYVGLRGGNNYPTLIRKFEPKPIRIFLQDGENDLNIYGGDWWMANQEMERALKFAGYEVNHAWGKGGHDGKHATEVFPEAMRWLWQDWPAPVKAGTGSPQLQEILLSGERWSLVEGRYKSAASLAPNAKGEVVFSELVGKYYKIGRDGKITSYPGEATPLEARAFGPDGRLYFTASLLKKILVSTGKGKPGTFAEDCEGNALVVRHDGRVYGTEIPTRPWDEAIDRIWCIEPKGTKKSIKVPMMAPSGVALSPDQTLLYVASHTSHWVFSYQIQSDGSLAHGQRYYHLHVPDTEDGRGASSLAVDRDGRLYVATRMGIQVCDQAGRVNCIIPTPKGRLESICFGGEKFDTLFAICGDRVYKRKVKVKGANAFEAPHKPAPPRL